MGVPGALVCLVYCPEDGEVFQTGKSFVYFIVKGEVEIWKARHALSTVVKGLRCSPATYDLVILCRKATSSCCYSRVKSSHLKLRNSMDSLLCLESKTSTELLRFGDLAALRKLPFRQAGCHEQSSRPERT